MAVSVFHFSSTNIGLMAAQIVIAGILMSHKCHIVKGNVESSLIFSIMQ